MWFLSKTLLFFNWLKLFSPIDALKTRKDDVMHADRPNDFFYNFLVSSIYKFQFSLGFCVSVFEHIAYVLHYGIVGISYRIAGICINKNIF